MGFLPIVTDFESALHYAEKSFNPVLGFLPVVTGGQNTAKEVKKLSQWLKLVSNYVNGGCTVVL